MSWEKDLIQWAESRKAPVVTAEATERLLERAARKPRVSGWMVLSVVAAAALVLFLVRPPAPEIVDGPVQVVVMESGSYMLGADTLSWTALTKDTVIQVREEPFQLRVIAGSVQLQLNGEPLKVLGTGDLYSFVEPEEPIVTPVPEQTPVPVLDEPAPNRLPTLDELRKALLAGELPRVRGGLQQRLEADPDDAKSWRLKAQLEKKEGRIADAVAAWREVIRSGSPSEANQARYEAAVLLDEQPGEAEPLLRAFLDDPGPLAADARLRLGRMLLAQGRTEEAGIELQRVVDEHPGTTPARIARDLLSR